MLNLVSEDVFCETVTEIISLFNDFMIQMCHLTLVLRFGVKLIQRFVIIVAILAVSLFHRLVKASGVLNLGNKKLGHNNLYPKAIYKLSGACRGRSTHYWKEATYMTSLYIAVLGAINVRSCHIVFPLLTLHS